MSATLNEQIIMMEELARVGAPHLPVQGLNHLGPILMEFGTEAQKAKHLPPIIAGTVIWAQGYSEPGAGSDLASLSTRATLDGDHFVVRGQKIWTTWRRIIRIGCSRWSAPIRRRSRDKPASASC
jgi:alkylation response protein AidB-like acyl-CoA dehydrogenase